MIPAGGTTSAPRLGARPRRSLSLGPWPGRIVPPLVAIVGLVLVWEGWTSRGGRQIIPAPSAIVRALVEDWDTIRPAAVATYIEAMGGLAIGTIAGLGVAFATARWALARDVVLPVAIGASAIPLVAAAPLLVNWFGILNPLSMMMMAALIVFFPVVVNVTRGLVEVQPAALELMRSYASSPATVLRKVRVPNMLPFLFTALKVSTTLAFIGAIVGEYFGGASRVLGKVVMTSLGNGSLATAWAAIVVGAAGAIASYILVALAERLLIPWATAMRAEDA